MAEVEAAVVAAASAAASPADSRWSAARSQHDELIAGTQRGILVTHFFYIRFLDQRTVLLTGLTRDGTFLIENGKITKASRTSAGTRARCSCSTRSRTSAERSRRRRVR